MEGVTVGVGEPWQRHPSEADRAGRGGDAALDRDDATAVDIDPHIALGDLCSQPRQLAVEHGLWHVSSRRAPRRP